MSKFAGFINGFAQGMSIADRYNSMKERKATKEDLKKIAEAKPETSTGFTADDGDQLRKAAESGQYDIGFDDESQAYTVTPKADPSQVGVIKQRGVTDFLGSRSEGKMSGDQVEAARQRAMAGVISRTDPITGARMMRDVTETERNNERYGWEKRRAEREDRKFAKEEANDQFMQGLEADVGQFMQSRLAGPDGQVRPATVDDYLASSQYKAAKLMEAGKTDAAAAIMKDYSAQSFVKIQLETAERDKALGETIAAVNAGNLDAARAFYDRFLPDGATVTDVQQDAMGRIQVRRQSATGQEMPPMVFADANQLTASLASLKDPMAVYQWSQNEFRNAMAIKADARAERADARAASSAEAGRGDDAARTAAALALFQERNPNATPAEIEAVRRGVLPAVPKEKEGGYKLEAGDVTSLLGTPATDARGNPLMDPLTGRQVVNRNPQRERELLEFMRDNNITDTNEGLQKFLAPRGERRPAAAPVLKKGQIVDGHEFLGGNPKDEKNWRQVATGRVN